MPPPNNPSAARVALEVDRDTRKFVNTFHVARTDDAALSLTDLTNIANVFANWWANNYRSVNRPEITGDNVVATKLDPAAPLQVTVGAIGAGTHTTGSISPGNVSLAVSWRTNLAGRKFRGRFYDFSIPDDVRTTDDKVNGAYSTVLLNIAAALLNQLATAGLKAVIYHRATDTYTTIAGVVIEALIDSMRNRLAARGI